MKKQYIKGIVILLISIILSFVAYFYLDSIGWKIISTILGNICAGLITGFVLLLITNFKNSLIFKNEDKKQELRNLIDRISNCEIKAYEINDLLQIPIIELINLIADISLVFDDIYSYNSNLFEVNKANYEILRNECDEMNGKLSEIMYLLNITQEKYVEDVKKELFGKIAIIYKLKIILRKDLNVLEKEYQKLKESIL